MRGQRIKDRIHWVGPLHGRLVLSLQLRRADGIWFQGFRPYIELKQRMSTMFWSNP